MTGEGKRGGKLFGWLMRLLPAEFRDDYGREMEHVFQNQAHEAQSKGEGLRRVWWETVTGIFLTAPSQHWQMLKQDTGYALRMMRKSWGYTLAVIATLGLGIGANTAIFSVINGVLLKPLPYRNGQQLLVLQQHSRNSGARGFSFSEQEMNDYRKQSQTLADLVEYHSMSFTLLGLEEPLTLQTGVVSWNFFDLFGVKPVAGRNFLPSDEQHGAEAVLMLSHKFWMERFGGDPKVVGRMFEMNNRPHRVIGVLPPVPQYPDENDIYMPTTGCPTRSSERARTQRNFRMSDVFARVKPGTDLQQVQADLHVITSRLKQDHKDAYPETSGFRASATELKWELTRRARPTFLVLLGTAGFVLLIACLNVANLTLSRVLRREQELAIRSALGANRSRLLRQMLTESTLLALAGGLLGIVLAWGGLDLLVRFATRFTPRAGEVELNLTVLAYALGISVLSGILFGSIPALTGRENPAGTLHETSGRATATQARQRVRSALVVAQVSVSFLLLIGAGLMLRSFWKLQQVDAGFNPENVVAARVTLNFTKYDTPDRRREFFRQFLGRLKANPSVQSATTTLFYPLNQPFPLRGTILIEGRQAESQSPFVAHLRVGSLDYFRALGIPLMQGRLFDEHDGKDAPLVAVINQALARKYWRDEDPIGKRISRDNGQTWTTIVGIVGDVKETALDKDVTEDLYVPYEQVTSASHVLVRTTGDPTAIVKFVRDTVWAVDPQQPVDEIRTLVEVRGESLASPRLTTVLLGIFAALALVITATGISGVMALSVSQRTHEIGVRMALGATPGNVLRMVMGQGLGLVVAGLVLGVVGAMWLTRLMSGLLFAVQPTDPLTFVGVSAALLTVAAAACWLPAKRAVGIDPMRALRVE